MEKKEIIETCCNLLKEQSLKNGYENHLKGIVETVYLVMLPWIQHANKHTDEKPCVEFFGSDGSITKCYSLSDVDKCNADEQLKRTQNIPHTIKVCLEKSIDIMDKNYEETKDKYPKMFDSPTQNNDSLGSPVKYTDVPYPSDFVEALAYDTLKRTPTDEINDALTRIGQSSQNTYVAIEIYDNEIRYDGKTIWTGASKYKTSEEVDAIVEAYKQSTKT